MAQSLAFAQLIKVDSERRLIYARAAQEIEDHSKEILDYESSVPYFKSWSEEMNKATGGLSCGNLRSMHGQICAGKVAEIAYNDEECAIDMVVKVTDDNEWRKVLDGCYSGLSIGGRYAKKWVDGDLTRYSAHPSEVSLVDRPCIPTATFFSIHKSDGSIMTKSFQTPDLAKSSEATDELNADHTAVDVAKAAEDIEYQVEGTPEDADALAKLLHDNKLSIGDAVKAIQTATEAPLIADLAKRYEGDEVEPEFMADLLALEKVAARADVNPKAGKSKYGDVKFADEKNNKYPIENEAHIRAAWNYINKEKNAAKYSAEDLSAIKGKIESAWKAKIDKAGPPSAEKVEVACDLEKGGPGSGPQGGGNERHPALDAAAHAASAKGPLSNSMHTVGVSSFNAMNQTKAQEMGSAARESLKSSGYAKTGERAGNKSGTFVTTHTHPDNGHTVHVSTPLSDARHSTVSISERAAHKSASTGDLAKGLSDCGRLGDMLQGLYYMAMCCKRESMNEGDDSPIPARLSAVVTELADIYKGMAAEEADELLAEMNEEDSGITSQASVMQMAAGMILPLMKAGARNSAADMNMIQQMHDMSGKLGAECLNQTEKMMTENELTKSTDEKKVDDTGDLAKADFTKMLADALEPLNKALGAANDEIKMLKAQPMPARGVLRVVSKSNDVVEIEQPEIAKVRKADGTIDEAATMMKKIFANGGHPVTGGHL